MPRMIVEPSPRPSSSSGMESARQGEAAFQAAITDGLTALRPHYAAEIAALKRRGARRQTVRLLGGMAVVVALALAAGYASFGWGSPETAAAMPRSLTLADGSRIHLDAGAAVRLPLAPWRRAARLLGGDAVFEIRHDDARPFVVEVGAVTVTDLGTRFLVQARPEAVAVAVFEGKVETATPANPPLVLSAGQAAASAPSGFVETAMPDEGETTAWREGRLVFRNTPLAKVAERLSRYRTEPVVVEGTALAALRVNGTFRLDDTDGALRTLETALPVRVRHENGRTTVLPAATRR